MEASGLLPHFNQGGPLGSPLAKAAAVGLAGLVAKNLLSNRQGGGFGGNLFGGGQQYRYGRGDRDDERGEDREGYDRGDRDDERGEDN